MKRLVGRICIFEHMYVCICIDKGYTDLKKPQDSEALRISLTISLFKDSF